MKTVARADATAFSSLSECVAWLEDIRRVQAGEQLQVFFAGPTASFHADGRPDRGSVFVQIAEPEDLRARREKTLQSLIAQAAVLDAKIKRLMMEAEEDRTS